MDEGRPQERSQLRGALTSAVDEPSATLGRSLAVSAATSPGALGGSLASASPQRGRPSMTESSQPPTPLPEELEARQAARRLSDACESAAADAADTSTPVHKRRRRNRNRRHHGRT